MAETKTLAAAMAKAFAEIESATKSAPGQVGNQKYKYADLTSVIEAIKPALVNNGLFFTQSPRPNDKGVEIETTLHHANGEVFSLGSLFVPADRNNAQAFGSALTYARRYALVTAFGVPVEDDDGSAAASAPPKREPNKNAPLPPVRDVPTIITDEQRPDVSGQKVSVKQPKPELITDEQRSELEMLFTHLGVPVKGFLEFAKIKDLRNVRAESFERAKGWINEQAKANRDTLADDGEFLKGDA